MKIQLKNFWSINILFIASMDTVESDEIPKKVLNFSAAFATANSPWW